jgi:ADP-heptose:LPS heptosyltransferase
MFFSYEKNDDRHVAFDEKKHFLQNNISLVYALCKKMDYSDEILNKIKLETETQMHWYLQAEEQEEANRILDSKGIKETHKIICIIPGGGNNPMRDEQSYRQWGSNKFKYLIDNLSKLENTHILILGSKNEEELGISLIDGNDLFVSNLAGSISLRIAAAIMNKADLIITNDTGPMHMAGALGIPLLALFGPTGAKEKLPPTNHSIGIQSSLHCSPCYYAVFRGCIYYYPKCMSTIREDKVCEIAKEILNNPQTNIQYGFNHFKIVYS